MSESYKTLARLFYLSWHHGHVFFRKLRFLPPVVLWMFVLALCFDINNPPVNAALGYRSTMPWLFFVMVWFGYLFLSSLETVEEYILVLHINSRFLYIASKIVFLVAVLLILSLFGCILPVIIELVFRIRGLVFISGGVSLADFFSSFVLNFSLGLIGVSLAFLFHPNTSKQRDDSSLVLLILFAILAVIKDQIFNLQGVYRYILFVFTPVIDIMQLFFNKDVFVAEDIMLAALYAGVYCLIVMVVGYWLYVKKIYGPLIAKNE